MKISTKIAAFATAFALTLTSLPLTETPSAAVYAATVSDGYFYSQLTAQSKVFYSAMEQMLEQGVFKTGDGDFDLVANGLLTSRQAEEYGVTELLSQYGAARDAFCADHADIFYVDFSYLTLRVTTDSSGEYHVYLGAGRSDNYYTEGFTSEEQVNSAIAEYEAAISGIVNGAKTVAAKDGSSLNAEMVKYVHNYIINHTSYRLEDACKPENIGFIRTAYGSLVKGEAVCEGYSRAVKAVLDRLGIPCVLVYGVYMHDKDTPELHMWCQVQLEGAWYAVDATFDDPRGSSQKQGIDGYENQDYLLVGSSCMDRQHYPSGIMSPVEYEFKYPALSTDGYNVEVVGSYGGLTVKFKSDGELEGVEAGIFYVSYNGMGYAKSAEQGRYLIAKMDQYYEATNEWNIGEWGYIMPDLYRDIEDFPTEVRLPLPHVPYVEFAVTDIPPEDYSEDNPEYSIFKGDITTFPAYSGVIYNPSGTYVKPPCVKSVTPGVSSMIDVEKTHHVVVVYDDVLQLSDENAQVGISMSARNALQYDAPCSAERFAKVENVKWDGVSTVEFDFTPSRMWLDDSVFYFFSVTGLAGARSGKAPRPISYCTRFAICPCAYRPYGYDWTLFAKPTLMENFDMDVSSWTTADNTKISQELANRMVLVASEPSPGQTEEMLDRIGGNVLGYQTFNINLTVCKAQVVSTGQAVRVHLGFPEGYGPDDAGVTFKAYHFSKDSQGNITGVEEIPCIITQYGLVILCNSFSPYAVVAVPADKNAPANKSVILTVPEGAEVKGDGVFTLAAGDAKTVTVTAKDGYVIESVTAMGQVLEVTDNKSMDITVSYGDIAGISGIIDVKLVAESVYERDLEREEAAVVAVPDSGKALENAGTSQSGASAGGSWTGWGSTVTSGTVSSDDADNLDEEKPEENAPEPEENAPEADFPAITDEAAAEPDSDGSAEYGPSDGEYGKSEDGLAAGSQDGSANGSDSNPMTGTTVMLITAAALLTAGAGVVIHLKKKRS